MFSGGVSAAVLPYEPLDSFGFLDHVESRAVDVLGDYRCEQRCAIFGEFVFNHDVELGSAELLRGGQPPVADDYDPPRRNRDLGVEVLKCSSGDNNYGL